jgi:hypothetical protein
MSLTPLEDRVLFHASLIQSAARGQQCPRSFFDVPRAEVAELADALASGASTLTGVGVQLPSSAPSITATTYR